MTSVLFLCNCLCMCIVGQQLRVGQRPYAQQSFYLMCCLSWGFYCCCKLPQSNWGRKGLFHFSPSGKTRAGTRRQELSPRRKAAYLFPPQGFPSLLSCKTQDHLPWLTPPTVSGVFHISLQLRKHHRPRACVEAFSQLSFRPLRLFQLVSSQQKQASTCLISEFLLRHSC